MFKKTENVKQLLDSAFWIFFSFGVIGLRFVSDFDIWISDLFGCLIGA